MTLAWGRYVYAHDTVGKVEAQRGRVYQLPHATTTELSGMP